MDRRWKVKRAERRVSDGELGAVKSRGGVLRD